MAVRAPNFSLHARILDTLRLWRWLWRWLWPVAMACGYGLWLWAVAMACGCGYGLWRIGQGWAWRPWGCDCRPWGCGYGYGYGCSTQPRILGIFDIFHKELASKAHSPVFSGLRMRDGGAPGAAAPGPRSGAVAPGPSLYRLRRAFVCLFRGVGLDNEFV